MKPQSPRIGAIVLSAGESRRMHGTHKALLLYQKRPFILTIIQALHAYSLESPVIVVLGHQHEQITDLLADENISITYNMRGLDQFSSIQCGLKMLFDHNDGIRAVLVCPVDQPVIPVPLLDDLIAAWQRSSAACVIPTFEGKGGHPILLDAQFAWDLLNLSSEAGLREVVKDRTDTIRLEVNYPDIVNNINTPGAYDAFCLRHRDNENTD